MTLMLASAAMACLNSAFAADDDALALEAQPASSAPARSDARTADLRLYGEFAVGRLQRRSGLGDSDMRRASIDYSQTFRPAPGWRAVVSDRLDDMHPAGEGERATTNSLREAYASWQDDGGGMARPTATIRPTTFAVTPCGPYRRPIRWHCAKTDWAR
jgi:hypothetical protein